MSHVLVTPDWVGWLATAVFTSSYFSKQPAALRWMQAVAALLWFLYGVGIHSLPMMVANALVAGAAVFSSFTTARPGRT